MTDWLVGRRERKGRATEQPVQATQTETGAASGLYIQQRKIPLLEKLLFRSLAASATVLVLVVIHNLAAQSKH